MTPPPAATAPAIICGDCRDVLPGLEPVDAVVTDPPYGLEFMGQGWDRGVPGIDFWTVVSDAMKPGAHLLAFGGTRTFHRLTCAIEDAGFEIRDCLMWVYGSGFPKSLDVSKAMDKALGAERDVVGRHQGRRATPLHDIRGGGFNADRPNTLDRSAITAPATEAANEWDGWGTALKPAWEPIILARKPLEGTVAENVQKHGTGALNIDACRINPGENVGGGGNGQANNGGRFGSGSGYNGERPIVKAHARGRWPANLIHDGSDEVLELFPEVHGAGSRREAGGWKSDSGSAARFFYCAKASNSGRGNETKPALPLFGIEEETFRNEHPTVKPVELMRYLCRLATPPGGTVLDPFAGSGSTLIAARAEGFRSIGIELKPKYCEMAERRIQNP